MSNSSIVLIAAQGVAASASYLYAALGEAFGQRAGIFNLGVEGMMLMGAFTAYFAVLTGQSPIVGVALAALVGAAMGLLMAFISVTLKAEQGMRGGIGGRSVSRQGGSVFHQNMANGLGFIAVALVYFGGWSPLGIMLGTLLLSVVTTLQLWTQTFKIPISPPLISMLPNIVTILSLAVATYFYRTQAPSSLRKPY